MKGLGLTLALLVFARPVTAETGLTVDYSRLSGETRKGALSISGKAWQPQQSRRAIFRIISWNVQTFGGGLNDGRKAAYSDLLDHMFATSRSAKVLAMQEVAQDKGANIMGDLLPGGEDRWNKQFEDTADAQDNGFFTQKQIKTNCEQFMFAERDENGRWQSNRDKALHPVRVSHMQMGDFDFTLINLHLTFAKGEPGPRVKEMRNVLDWVQEYLKDPNNDPDVIIVGDFNTPVRGGSSNLKGPDLEDVLESYPAFARQYDKDGKRVHKPTELIALVDKPTSRSKGQPVNNYDHFILSGDVYDEEYVEGSAGQFPAKLMGAIEKKHDAFVSDHLPISAGFIYKGEGNNGEAIRPDKGSPSGLESGPSCWNPPTILAENTKAPTPR